MIPEPQKIGMINTIGCLTLIKREVDRFLNVYTQTIVAPVITTLMFYTIFALALDGTARIVGNVPFLEFLAPGLIMMTMVQNAFSNTSSSLVISKIQGSIIDVLMPPLSDLEICLGFIVGGVLRGIVVGICTMLVISFFVTLHFHAVWLIIIYAVLGTVLLSAIGVAAGIWSDKFDHIAAVTNFIVTPLTFLSGTFYSVESLPDLWQWIAHFNPFFYMIDGFRAGFIGHADGDPFLGIWVLVLMNVLTVGIAYGMLRTGYKIKF